MPIRVVQLGVGPIGASLVRLASRRATLEIVGAVDLDPMKVGRTLGEVAGATMPRDVTVRSDLGAVLVETRPQVVLQATSSSLARIAPELETAIQAGANVVSTCEELVYPYRRHQELAAWLDGLAKRHGSVILGAGVNPGFAMDTFPLVVSGVCEEVERISVRRVQEAGNRRLPLQLKIGAGTTVDEFRLRLRAGTIGHVGLRESAAMMADALGWELEAIEETTDPVIAEHAARSPHVEVSPGHVSGIHQVLTARSGGREVITLELLMHIGAVNPRDEVEIFGTPPVHVVVLGGFPGDPATAAIIVNSIPRVLSAPPGLHSMTDMSVTHSVARRLPSADA